MYNVIRKQLDTEIQLRKVKKAGVFFCKTFSSEKKDVSYWFETHV